MGPFLLPWNYLKLRTQILSTPYFQEKSRLGPDTPSEETTKYLTIAASDRNRIGKEGGEECQALELL